MGKTFTNRKDATNKIYSTPKANADKGVKVKIKKGERREAKLHARSYSY